MSRKIVSYILFLLGLIFIIFPFVSFEKAYFVGDDHYITMVDTIENRYPAFIRKLIEKEQRAIAYEEKLVYSENKKIASTILQRQKIEAKIAGDGEKLAEAKKKLKNLQENIDSAHLAIDEKYQFEKINFTELTDRIKIITDTFTVEDFVVVTANTNINPYRLKSKPTIKKEDINIQKVNLQSKTPFLVLGIVSILLGLFVLLFAEEVIVLNNTVIKYALVVTFFAGAIIFSYKAWQSLDNEIKFKEVFEERQDVVKAHLLKLKSVQEEYKNSKGVFANKWAQLIKFAQSDSVQIIKILVNKDDTAAVNYAIKQNQPLEDTLYLTVKEKVFGKESDVNFNDLPIVPFSTDSFLLKTDYIFDSNDNKVNVMEIKTKKETFVKELSFFPENFNRMVAPEIYISVGSLKETTLEGNW